MRISDFIQKVLIEEFRQIERDEGHHYISFSLICQGIEFLGACFDSEPFSAKGRSAARFRRAVYDLFPVSYRPFSQGTGRPFDLYENLRCGLLHVILSESPIELLRRTGKTDFDLNHLDVKEIRGMSRLVLVLEDLFDDYEKACKEIIARIHDGRLRGWKFEGDVLTTG